MFLVRQSRQREDSTEVEGVTEEEVQANYLEGLTKDRIQ